MDQQVALELARKGGFGLGKMIAGQLASRDDAAAAGTSNARTGVDAALTRGGLRIDAPRAPYAPGAPAGPADPGADAGAFPKRLPATLRGLAPQAATGALGESSTAGDADDAGADPAEDFVRRLLPDATAAAQTLGVEPRLLLAQAALETGWGSATARRPDSGNGNNLFGIKAGAQWSGELVTHWTTEHENGAEQRKLESFRAYASPADSFADYVHLISSSPRYAEALENAHDPEAYAHSVADAGYATDPNYVEKWLSIYRGNRLGGALDGLKPADSAPTQ
jgi:flagellar protein FlgJ